MDTISNNLTKRPIASVLKAMQIDGIETFPLIQIESVRNAITKLQLLDRVKKFTTKINDNSFTVTRLS
jgi:hypothetical protein